MSQYAFGAGTLVGTALSDAYGNVLATPTPIQFGITQDISIDLTSDVKELFGQFQLPVAVARGKTKVVGKIKFAQINGFTFNNIFFGQTIVSGQLGEVIATSGTAIPTTPFTITPTIPNSGTYLNDLGVIDAFGKPMSKVISGPVTGQYMVAAGVYTFAAADVGLLVRISLQYTATSTIAKKLVITNTLMGIAPTFRADIVIPDPTGKQMIFSLNQCVATKLSLATKLDDFMIPEIDFSCFVDASGTLGTLGLAE